MIEKEFQKFKEIISPGDLIFIFPYYDDKIISSFVYLAPTIFESTFKLLCLKHQNSSLKRIKNQLHNF